MARIPRNLIVDNDATLHITWQCHNKSWFLEGEEMKQLYYDLLLRYKAKYEIKVYSYSFMDSHPHLTINCRSWEKLAGYFQIVNSMFAKRYNKIHDRRGQVIMDRYKSPSIETDDDHVAVVVYGDFNQVRAAMVSHPKEWKWSSYRHYAYGKIDPLIDDAPFYINMGKTSIERELEYRRLANDVLKEECLKKQDYSSVYFIGDATWVKERQSEMWEKVRQNRRPSQQVASTGPPG